MRMRLPAADVPPRSRASAASSRLPNGPPGGFDVAGRDVNIGHIFRNILPMMRRRGFSEDEIETLMVRTPARLLTFV